jgi:hypothetical protein
MNDKYWFHAKRHGWGWGPPATWQGWLVLVVFIALVAGGALIFPPRRELMLYLAYVAVLCAALVFTCWRTGERPGWRWGDK